MNLAPRSLRWRIQLWHSLLLVAVLAGLGVTAYQLHAANEYRRLDVELALRVNALSASLAQPGQGPPPGMGPGEGRPPPRSFQLSPQASGLFAGDDYYYLVWTRRGTLLGHSPNVPLGVPLPEGSDSSILRSRSGYREQAHFTPPGECLLAGISEATLHGELFRFALKLTALGSVVLLLAMAGGSWIAARAIAPIEEISATARRIAQGELRERIPVAGQTLELAEVATVLNSTFAQLEQMFLEQARFTSDAAHELRTPVSIVLAQAQLALSRPRGADELRESIITMRRSAERMQNLIESLLELSVLETHLEPSQLLPCDLGELAREQLHFMQPLAAERQIALECDCESAPCTGDAGRLSQVFTNLLANALKYCQPGARVRVSTKLENGHALALVQDNGPGIAAEHHPHLFQRFYRADASRNRATGGAGLGLAICRTIVGAHGGTITVQPSPGSGVTFEFRVPRG